MVDYHRAFVVLNEFSRFLGYLLKTNSRKIIPLIHRLSVHLLKESNLYYEKL